MRNDPSARLRDGAATRSSGVQAGHERFGRSPVDENFRTLCGALAPRPRLISHQIFATKLWSLLAQRLSAEKLPPMGRRFKDRTRREALSELRG
jgi:hypothetical protein